MLAACAKSSDSTTTETPNTATIQQDLARFNSAKKRSKKEALPALRLCREIQESTVRSDCIIEVAPQVAKLKPNSARLACEEIDLTSECLFRVAEKTKNADLCSSTGELEHNCRMHILSFGLKKWLLPLKPFVEIIESATPEIKKVGLSDQSPDPWIAIWRFAYGSTSPLDRTRCATLPTGMLQNTCYQAGLELYQARLNNLRDRGFALCQGPLPQEAQYTKDKELDQILASRRTQDLCNPNSSSVDPSVEPSAQLPGSPK